MRSKKPVFLVLLACLVSAPVLADVIPEPELLREFGPPFGEMWPFERAGDLAFFPVGSDAAVAYLWRTDGTPAGTFQVGPDWARLPQFWTTLNNLVFFVARQEGESQNLWRSDGTIAGTFPLTQGLIPGIFASTTSVPVPELGLVFFTAGTPEGTTTDYELWATDGTVAGTRLVEDVNPEDSSFPVGMTRFGGRLYFTAVVSQDYELWTSDGTPGGTVRVKRFDSEIRAGSALLHQVDGKLLLLIRTENGAQVWRSDGTEAGTALVKEFPSWEFGLTALAGRRFFFSLKPELGIGDEIWVTDGTPGGTIRLMEVGHDLDLFEPVGEHLLFRANDAAHGVEPWWSDGTPGGTRLARDIRPGAEGSFPGFVGAFGGRALIQADDGTSGIEPWWTDGTEAGTYRLGDLCPGPCTSYPIQAWELDGRFLIFTGSQVRLSDGTEAGTVPIGPNLYPTGFPVAATVLGGKFLFSTQDSTTNWTGKLWALPITDTPTPSPPAGDWLTSTRVPGFRFKVRIGGEAGIAGRQESSCIAETMCVSGALAGRSEVFLRVVGPKPNGYLWPTLVKFSTSKVEVWVEQAATGTIRYYELEASGPTGSALPGIADRTGFLPTGASALVSEEIDAADTPPPVPGSQWITTPDVPGFRFQARLTSGGQGRSVRKEPCISETLCLSGALAGRPELFVRIVGPKPNGYLWPTLVRFTTSTVEVWIEQVKTGTVRYYRLEGPSRDSDALDGYFDKQGFQP